MDVKQQLGSRIENIKQQLSANQASLWTSLPGVIVDWDPVNNTCSVQPAIQGIKFGQGVIDMPLLVDCPVIFPRGQNCTITFPLNKGMSCLIIFGARCIDSWWASGPVDSNGNVTTSPQLEMRMHDLSDGFVIPGPFAEPEVISNISTSKLEIRANDNSCKISLDPINNEIDVIATTIKLNGDVKINGTITCNDINISDTHTHKDVQPGSGISGTPS